MPLYDENLRTRYAEDREYLERLMDLEDLLEATLSGFAVTSALRSDDPDGKLGTVVNAHRVGRTRQIGHKRRTNPTSRRALSAY